MLAIGDAIIKAINLAVPNGAVSKHNYPAWFSSILRTYIKKKNYFYRRYKKYKTDCFYKKFSFYRKLVKSTIKSDRSRWLHYVDENLKCNPQQFWKYVSQYRKKCNDATHFDVNGVLTHNSRDIAEAYSEHFQSVYVGGSSCPGTISTGNCFTDILPIACISTADVHKAIKRLRPTKSVGLDGIPSFIIKGCSEIFVPILRFIFNLSLSQNTFPKLWKQAVIIPVFKKRKSSVQNYRPMAILNNFSKIFESITHDHIYHVLKSKLNRFPHGFIKSRSTVTNLVTFLEFTDPLVCSQGQSDSIYFDFTNAFDILPPALLLRKLDNYGLSSGYINWLSSYLTNRVSRVRFSGQFSSTFIARSGGPQGSVLIFLATNCVK